MVKRTHAAFTLMELMLVVLIIGILGMVAIPAFVRYMRKAKTAEALDNINKMQKGLSQYFMKAHPDLSGAPQPCQFPEPGNTTYTPSLGTCCNQGGKCAPDPASWNTATWKAILFKIAEKHYFHYLLEMMQVDRTKIRLGASGDLDCDDTYSTFSTHLLGHRSGVNQIFNCHVSQPWGMHVVDETE